ncbi:MAG: prolipoprotein diacylglyceryl transferase [Anaerolineales bacterium]|nr:prolipoprotein diacylglyceryl transferase [Chloroflexota bacterium]MBL6983858.1 prolipoprotein diacylglyceryl transferase [Anaerolineales bacterium]
MLPILQIGPFAMQTPGLALLLGIWLGLTLAERLAPRFEANANEIYNLTFTALIAGIIGARLSYVLQYPDAFINSPLSLISLNPALLDPIGGAVIGAFAALIYGNRKKLPLWPTLDALTPLLAVAAIAVGISHIASGDAFGMQTDLPWGIELWGLKRHPSQIYEVILASFILGAILPKKEGRALGKRGSMVGGRSFWLFLSLSAGARLFLEGFRGDSLTLANGMRIAQVIAWVVLTVSLWMLHKRQNVEDRTS